MSLYDTATVIDWEPGVQVGVPGGIDQYLSGGAFERTTIIDVTASPYFADNTGATDAKAAVQAAIDAATSGQVVYLPAGTYRLDTTLNLNEHDDSITVRGAGMYLTTLDCRGSSAGIIVGSSIYDSFQTVTGTRTKGTTLLNIASTGDFTVGELCVVQCENQLDDTLIQAGAAPVLHVNAFDSVRKQLTRVAAVTGSTVTISPGLHFDCTGLTTHLTPFPRQTDFAGIEDLTIDGTNGALEKGLEFSQCYGCWAKGVRVKMVQGYSFIWSFSLKCEARECDIRERKGTDGPGGTGLKGDTCANCLFEDNIVYKIFPCVEMNDGACGNVVAYNCLEDSRSAGVIGGALNINHDPHNSYNLYEGNVTPSVQCDGYYGSASEDTIFRNWIHGSVIGSETQGYTLRLNRFTRNYNVLGNVIAAGLGTQYGLPNIGNDSFTGTAQPTAGDFWSDWAALKAASPGAGPDSGGFQEKDLDVEASSNFRANYYETPGDAASTEAALGADTLPDSMFRSSKPAYFGALAWPPFDPASPGSASYESIPAGYRYVNGDGVPETPGASITVGALNVGTLTLG